MPTPTVLASTDAPDQTWRSFVSLAGAGAGLPVHRHGESWLVALAGRKRWFVWPAGWGGVSLPPPFLNQSAFLAHVLEAARSANGSANGPQTVLQQPGDLLYLPADWAHATVNLDAAFAIGRQRRYTATELASLEGACFPRRRSRTFRDLPPTFH